MYNEFMTLEDAILLCPPIKATTHLGTDRYKFVSSQDIITNMQSIGFGLVDVRYPSTRKASPFHVKHEMIFHIKSQIPGIGLSYDDPRLAAWVAAGYKKEDAKVFPQLRVINSSDAKCGFKASLGVYVPISNHSIMMSGELNDGFSMAHVGFSEKEAQELLMKFTYRFPTLISRMEKMKDVILTEDQKKDFAGQAANLRFENGMDYSFQLLTPRRKIDNGDDLWTIFNVVQQNCLLGGFRVNSRRARALEAIDASRKVMTGLYDIAYSFLPHTEDLYISSDEEE